MRSLYPAGPVSDDVVLTVVGSLGHGQLKPSLPIQSLLLRWLVMVYHILDSRAVLSRSYAVLFNLLDTAAIRYEKAVMLLRADTMADNGHRLGRNYATCLLWSLVGNMSGRSESSPCECAHVP